MSGDAVSIPTPDISHLTEDDYEHVYEPAEDTFILLDALEQDAIELQSEKPSLCVEIGRVISFNHLNHLDALGSGVVSTFLSILLGPTDSLILGVDINDRACSTAARTAAQNGVSIEIVRSNLLTSLAGIQGKVDLLVFNPPYVPTEELEYDRTQGDKGIGGAWAGGGDGMGLTNLVLPLIPSLLAPGGRFYLVAVAPNKPLEIVAHMRQRGLEAEIVLKRRAGREHLSIIRAIKPGD